MARSGREPCDIQLREPTRCRSSSCNAMFGLEFGGGSGTASTGYPDRYGECVGLELSDKLASSIKVSANAVCETCTLRCWV